MYSYKNPWDWQRLYGGRYEWETVAYWFDGGQSTKLHRTYQQALDSKRQLMRSSWGKKMVKNVVIYRNRG